MMLSASTSRSPPKRENDKNKVMDDSSLPLYNRNATRLFKKAKPKLSSHSGSKLANVHDFRFDIDKCYCYKCLVDPIDEGIKIKKEQKDEKDENDEAIKMDDDDDDDDDAINWFNHSIWFNRDYRFHPLDI